jgi:hypothetical protein
MFRVTADSVETYLNFDPARRPDLDALDHLIRENAPSLIRYFHAGTPVGSPGMRFQLIGYGPTWTPSRGGVMVEWPVIGVALQKNYISVYLAVTVDNKPLTELFRGKLGELRMGENNFSFVRFADLNTAVVEALFTQAAHIHAAPD